MKGLGIKLNLYDVLSHPTPSSLASLILERKLAGLDQNQANAARALVDEVRALDSGELDRRIAEGRAAEQQS